MWAQLLAAYRKITTLEARITVLEAENVYLRSQQHGFLAVDSGLIFTKEVEYTPDRRADGTLAPRKHFIPR